MSDKKNRTGFTPELCKFIEDSRLLLGLLKDLHDHMGDDSPIDNPDGAWKATVRMRSHLAMVAPRYCEGTDDPSYCVMKADRYGIQRGG